MSNLKKLIGIRLRKLRKTRGLKQHQLAELIDVDPRTISRIEVGGNYPSFDLLEKILIALNYNISEFFNFDALKQSKIQDAISLLNKHEVDTIIKIAKLISK